MLVGLGLRAIYLRRARDRRGRRTSIITGSRVHVHPGTPAHIHIARGRWRGGRWLSARIHGLAGSGALTALVVTTLPSTAARLTYMAVFGLDRRSGWRRLSAWSAGRSRTSVAIERLPAAYRSPSAACRRRRSGLGLPADRQAVLGGPEKARPTCVTSPSRSSSPVWTRADSTPCRRTPDSSPSPRPGRSCPASNDLSSVTSCVSRNGLSKTGTRSSANIMTSAFDTPPAGLELLGCEFSFTVNWDVVLRARRVDVNAGFGRDVDEERELRSRLPGDFRRRRENRGVTGLGRWRNELREKGKQGGDAHGVSLTWLLANGNGIGSMDISHPTIRHQPSAISHQP